MIIGHKNQWKFLVKSAELNRLPHAFLFYGQEQLGKRFLATEFIKFLNCESSNYSKRPCQVCRNCQDIQRGVYPDFILIEPNSSGKEIQISQIRDVIGKLSLRPYSSNFKIAILDRAHLMTKEAQNCFLKFLEEPKGKAILILVTEYPQVLLPTILSRVQKIRFFPVKNEEIENYLKKEGLSKEKIKNLISFSSGKPGQLFNFLLDPQRIENQKRVISEFIEISQSDFASRFKYAKSLSEKIPNQETKNLKGILDIWLSYLRNIFLSRLGGQQRTEKFNQYSLSKLKKVIKLIQNTEFLISTTNANSKLALEVLLMEI